MSKELPKFSLLLPVYKGDSAEHFSKSFLTSTAQQSLPPTEVVLVQDGSVSHQLALAISDAIDSSAIPVKLVKLEKNSGLATALNMGIEEAAYEIIARMDADDISNFDRFEKQIPLLASDYDLVGSAISEFEDNESNTLAVRPVAVTMSDISERAKFRSPFNHPTVVYRKSAVIAAGGYQPMGTMEDYWLWVRMLKNGARVTNINEPLVKYRLGSGAYQRRGGKNQWQSEIAIQKAMLEIGFISKGVYLRNILLRGLYRFVPTPLRKIIYRKAFTN